MEPILNTLYVLTEGAYVHVDHETLVVEHEGEKLIQAPVHHLGAVCLFGNIMISPLSAAAAPPRPHCLRFM